MLEITARGDCVLIRVVHMGVHKGGGSHWVHEKGGFTGGHTRGVHVNHGNPLATGLASVQYIHKPFHNAALGLETLVLQLKKGG